MNFDVWKRTVAAELEAAGFVVTWYDGFPLASAQGFHRKMRLLNFKPRCGADSRVYLEGVLFVPRGAGRMLDENGYIDI